MSTEDYRNQNWEPPLSSEELDKEIEALRACWRALEPLDEKQRRRALDYLSQRCFAPKP